MSPVTISMVPIFELRAPKLRRKYPVQSQTTESSTRRHSYSHTVSWVSSEGKLRDGRKDACTITSTCWHKLSSVHCNHFLNKVTKDKAMLCRPLR